MTVYKDRKITVEIDRDSGEVIVSNSNTPRASVMIKPKAGCLAIAPNINAVLVNDNELAIHPVESKPATTLN